MARRARGSARRGSLGQIVRWFVGAWLVFVVVSVLWVVFYRFVPPPFTFTQLEDRLSGRHVTSAWMSIGRIDRNMVRAAIAAEDSRFCSHHGFDEDAIAAAMMRNARGGSIIRGGSTVSQQTAKNAFLWQGGGYFRKAIEAWFTLLIETIWGKRRIMEVYLNVGETGIGTYGANAGALRYFGHDASHLSRVEAARIAAVLPLPKKRGAIAPHGFTRRYGNSIAARMAIVARDGLDSCVYLGTRANLPAEAPPPRPVKRRGAPAPAAPAPAQPQTVPGEEYERPASAPPDERQLPPDQGSDEP